jgi:hypothetical protein
MEQNILETIDIKNLMEIIRIFDGQEREFCLRRKDGSYSKRFMIKNKEQLLANIAYYSHNQPFEINFSVQRIKLPSRHPFTWSLIMDLDGSRKGTNANRLKELLNKFSIIYLVDSRLHLWIPDWQTCLIPNWNSLYGDLNGFVLPLKYYLEKVANFSGCSIDEQLWNTKRHLMRMPYSSHHSSNSIQKFMREREEALAIWDGSYFDSDLSEHDTYYYAQNFKKFIEVAIEYGKEIIQALGRERALINYNYAYQSGELRPCFKAALATKHMNHMQRMALVSEARSFNLPIAKIHELFKTQDDYVSETTEYQLNYLLKRKGFRWGCNGIKRHGFCLMGKCTIYKRSTS